MHERWEHHLGGELVVVASRVVSQIDITLARVFDVLPLGGFHEFFLPLSRITAIGKDQETDILVGLEEIEDVL